MDTNLYKAAMEGNTDTLTQNKHLLEHQLTPTNNTLLHVAAQFGHIQCAMEILNACPSMYRKVNARGDTALHVASREGHSTIVRALVEYANALDEELEDGGVGTAKGVMRVENKEGETALHEAVRNHHAVAVQLLAEGDPEFCHPVNSAGETPLYLAAERGYVGLVFVILESCTAPAYGGPGGRTALHSAVIHDLEGCTKKLLDWKPALCKETDVHGWTPLHYAAQFGYVSRVKELLKADQSVAYMADTDKQKTALHLAASRGHVHVLEEIISHCPDCWEMVDGNGQNILHIAAKNKEKRVIKFILQSFSLSGLINQKDVDGNTPLHLLAASGCNEASLVKHVKCDRMVFNKENLTPLDVVYGNKNVEPWGFTRRKFRSAGANLGQRHVISRDKDEIEAKEKHHTNQDLSLTDIRRAADTNSIVAALIATVSFVAAFILLSGHNGDDARKSAFNAFVVTDAMAMMFSATAVFVNILVAANSEREKILKHYGLAKVLVIIAMGAMVLGFVTGTYAMLPHSLGIAMITLCVIWCFLFPIGIFLLKKALRGSP